MSKIDTFKSLAKDYLSDYLKRCESLPERPSIKIRNYTKIKKTAEKLKGYIHDTYSDLPLTYPQDMESLDSLISGADMNIELLMDKKSFGKEDIALNYLIHGMARLWQSVFNKMPGVTIDNYNPDNFGLFTETVYSMLCSIKKRPWSKAAFAKRIQRQITIINKFKK